MSKYFPIDPVSQQPTLADHYNAAIRSADLVNAYIDQGRTTETEDLDTIWRNVEHLRIVLAREQWTEEFDLTPLQAAVAAGEQYVV